MLPFPSTCRNCSGSFVLRDKDFVFYQKVQVPPPTLCPDCRLQRRLAFRNDTNLYTRKCDFSGKNIISMFAPESKFTVYEQDIWWSDQWDATKYGRDYDFSKPFFEQFRALNEAVPQFNLINFNNENSPYNNYTGWNKNCYLCFAGNRSQDCFHCYNAQQCTDCADSLFLYGSELSYECVHSEDAYNSSFLLHSKNCRDSFFLEDCVGCSNCFMSFNLHRKEYYILNKPYSKDEYFQKIREMNLGSYEGLERAKKVWREESLKYPKRENHNLQSENCFGEYISNSKNCRDCYIVQPGCEDCTHVFNGFPRLKDSYDCTFSGEDSSLMYECMGTGVNNYMTSWAVLSLNNLNAVQYAMGVMNSNHCFGCSNLKNESYCILNKKYSKEEYEEILPRIIAHMKSTAATAGQAGEYGEFFPIAISPFGYNETAAQENFPLTKEQALAKGYGWRDEDVREYRKQIFTLPDTISDVPDSIIQEILSCVSCQKNYRIIAQELAFYRKKGFPVPRKCPKCRHLDRLVLRNQRGSFVRSCQKCQKQITTSYAPSRSETVFCESCFLESIE